MIVLFCRMDVTDQPSKKVGDGNKDIIFVVIPHKCHLNDPCANMPFWAKRRSNEDSDNAMWTVWKYVCNAMFRSGSHIYHLTNIYACQEVGRNVLTLNHARVNARYCNSHDTVPELFTWRFVTSAAERGFGYWHFVSQRKNWEKHQLYLKTFKIYVWL